MDISSGCDYPRSLKVVHKECGVPIELITGCKQRFVTQCPVCAKNWAKKIRGRIYDAVTSFKNPSFLTLTLVKQRTNVHRMKSLWGLRRALFQELRRRGYSIEGWIAVVEYPNHLHICMDSLFIPKQVISKIWRAKTGDSYIVDIKRIGQRAGVATIAKYLSKYLAKSTGWPAKVIEEMRGFHVVQSHGIPKTERHRMACPCCGRVGGFLWINDMDFAALDRSPVTLIVNHRGEVT